MCTRSVQKARKTLATQEFIEKATASWIERLIGVFNGTIPSQCTWTRKLEIMNVLGKMAGRNIGHLYFPGGGGNDLNQVRGSSEQDCIELHAGGPNVIKPTKLTFYNIGGYLAEWSFFYLQCEGLQSCGVTPFTGKPLYEPITELMDGTYLDYECYQTGLMGGPDGPVPLPEGTRTVSRYIEEGTFLLVCKASIYNIRRFRELVMEGDPYDGRHNNMSEADFVGWVTNMAQIIP